MKHTLHHYYTLRMIDRSIHQSWSEDSLSCRKEGSLSVFIGFSFNSIYYGSFSIEGQGFGEFLPCFFVPNVAIRLFRKRPCGGLGWYTCHLGDVAVTTLGGGWREREAGRGEPQLAVVWQVEWTNYRFSKIFCSILFRKKGWLGKKLPLHHSPCRKPRIDTWDSGWTAWSVAGVSERTDLSAGSLDPDYSMESSMMT